MLFDERDLRVFDSDNSRDYFTEILQSYYSKNYRAAIVMLYAFVIYDLFSKMQDMALEGDKKAVAEVETIKAEIQNEEKCSTIENKVVEFFLHNCPLYFERFREDVDYLRVCRNKCAHLKIKEDSLFVPADYQVRMLICSMYDHILSVRAPFIMDLFSVAQDDIERYSNQYPDAPFEGVDETIEKRITEKYFKRMTEDSLGKSYRSFLRLTFVSDDEDCLKNVAGLFVFLRSLINYLLSNGYLQIIRDARTLNLISRIEVDSLDKNNERRNALIGCMHSFPAFLDEVRKDSELFNYVREKVLGKTNGIRYFKNYYPESNLSEYGFFMSKEELHKPLFISKVYYDVKNCDDFSLHDYLRCMLEAVPDINGFDAADSVSKFWIDHLSELSSEQNEELLALYNSNPQCFRRSRHNIDMTQIIKGIQFDDGKNVDEKPSNSLE